MATHPIGNVIGNLRRGVLRQGNSGMTDGQLLECFVARRDEAAFEALVRLHGPMVLGVCRRLLSRPQDAEDAFQATFLVLARKAVSVVPREAVANWLYGVAYHSALKARALICKRRVREKQVTEMPEPVVPEPDRWNEFEPLLDQELSCLPDKYRLPLVLCELEGKTRKQVSVQLGWPEGTVAGRLARARALLAQRLTRRGMALSAGALAVALAQHEACAAVPPALVTTTVTAAAQVSAGTALSGVASTQVAIVTERVLKAMWMTKLKITTALLLTAGVLTTGGQALFVPDGWARPAHAAERAEAPPKEPVSPPPKEGKEKNDKEPSDHEYIRRVSLDILGRIATVDEIADFVKDNTPDKRGKLVDRLLAQQKPPEEALVKLLEEMIDRKVRERVAAHLAVLRVQKALKHLKESSPDEQAELQALEKVEQVVRERKEKLKQKKPTTDPSRR